MPKTTAKSIPAKTSGDKEALLITLTKSKSPMIHVSFAKKGSGETRHMTFCMPGRLDNTGKPTPYDRVLNDMGTNTLTVWDINKDGVGNYRRVNLEEVYAIVIDDVEYTIDY